MGLLDLFSNRKIKQLQNQNLELKRLASISFANLTANTNIALWPTENTKDFTDRYITTDDIYSIIKRLAETAALVPMYGYEKTKDEKSFNKLLRYNYKRFNRREYKSLQTKSLEDLPEVDPVAILLEKPHELMGKFEFLVELYSWLFMTGNAFIKKERPKEGVNQGMPVTLTFMPRQCVTLKITESLPHRVVGYDYRIDGMLVEENIPTSEVIHIKYWNPKTNDAGDGLWGLSPIEVLAKRLCRNDSNMNITTSHLQNSGVRTIVNDKSLVDVHHKDAVEIIDTRKDNYYRYAGNSRNAGMPYFATGEMSAVNVGSHLMEMGVIELGNIDFKKFCNAYAVSDRLFNNDATGSEISDDNARKGLYTNCVLPNIYRVRDALNQGLLPDFETGSLNDEGVRIRGDGKKRFIDADIADISELNEDMGKMVTALAAASWLTPNEKREVMNYEALENPLMDEILIPTGIVPLDDLLLPDPVEVVTPNGN